MDPLHVDLGRQPAALLAVGRDQPMEIEAWCTVPLYQSPAEPVMVAVFAPISPAPVADPGPATVFRTFNRRRIGRRGTPRLSAPEPLSWIR
jgi:hypothetical protein